MEKESVLQSSVRLKMGQMEVEFQGSEAFIREELKDLVSTLADVHKNAALATRLIEESTVPGQLKDLNRPTGDVSDHTVTSLANKFNCKTESDLVKAAATYLTFVKKTMPFSREELLQAMREGGAYFKDSYSRNLSACLERLVKEDTLRTQGSGYKLSPKSHAEFEGKLD